MVRVLFRIRSAAVRNIRGVSLVTSRLSEVLEEVLLQSQRICGGRVSLHRLAILVNNELGEVPFDGANQKSGLLHLEILVQRNGRIPIDVDLTEQIKLHSVLALCKLLDLCIGSWLLTCELIAGECQNSQPLAVDILLMQLDQFTVVAIG